VGGVSCTVRGNKWSWASSASCMWKHFTLLKFCNSCGKPESWFL